MFLRCCKAAVFVRSVGAGVGVYGLVGCRQRLMMLVRQARQAVC